MPDAQRIIEEIKHLLYSAGNPLPDEVASLAADYLELCNEADDRLRDCSRLLRRGLRSEAIQMAEHEPNLIDLVTTLDFAERPQWCDYLRQSQELLPPDLLLDEAAELNEAYAAEQPLTHLLQQHRLLALTRAPLVERIGAMRRIAAADAGNPVWEQDLVSFERVRHQQLANECAGATEAGDMSVLARLKAEVAAPGWRAPPPDELCTRLHQAHGRLRRNRALQELIALEPQLTAAHASFDVPQGRHLLARWQPCAAIADLQPHEALAEMAAPALAWLDEEGRREQQRADFHVAIAELERLLNEQADRHELERAYYEAARHDSEIPATLDVRYHERVAAMETVAGRRRKLLVAAAICGLLALTAATVAGVRHKLFVDEVAATSANLKKLIDDGRLVEAGQFLDGIKRERSAVAASAPVRDLIARYEGLRTEEAGRRTQFEAALAAAEALANSQPATLASLRDAEKQVERRVSAMARQPDERLRVDGLRRKIVSRRVEVQGLIDADFKGQVDKLTAALDPIEQGKLAPSVSADDSVLKLRKEAIWLRDHTEASSPLVTNLESLIVRIDAQHNALAERRERKILTDAVTRAVGDQSQFVASLKAYATRLSDTARAGHFRAVSQEALLWEGLEKWDSALKRMKLSDPAGFVAEAKKMLADPLLAAFEVAAAVRERLPYCEAAAARSTDFIPPAVSELLDNPFISEASIVEAREKGGISRYYVRKEPVDERKIEKIVIHYLVNFQLDEKLHSLPKADVVEVNGQLFRESPQRILAEKLRQVFRDHHGKEGWELVFCRALHEVVADSETDPILRVVMLKRLAEIAKEGSPVAGEVLADFSSHLEGGGLDLEANWLLPHDASVEQHRNAARKILAGLPALPPLAQVAEQKLQQLAALPTAGHDWIGWLGQDEAHNNAWRCFTTTDDTRSGDLFVVYRPLAEGSVRLEKIGRCQRGKAEVTAPEGAQFLEGRPVFRVVDTN